MYYTSRYQSPLGVILMAADEKGLTGLWFEEQDHFAFALDQEHEERELPVFARTKKWLDLYFAGKEPDFTVPLHLVGTAFQEAVWALLQEIPYGCTTSYGALAAQIAAKKGVKRMSAQAVGGAVGHNPVSIIVPCHRVIGSNGSLTGYAGGLDRKERLLALEQR